MSETSKKQYEIIATKTITVNAVDEAQALEHAKQRHGEQHTEFEVKSVSQVEPIDGPSVTVTFHPQEWVRGHATPTEPLGTQSFTVPRDDATTEDGHIFSDDSKQSDSLKNHHRAPQWVKDWNGPYYIAIVE